MSPYCTSAALAAFCLVTVVLAAHPAPGSSMAPPPMAPRGAAATNAGPLAARGAMPQTLDVAGITAAVKQQVQREVQEFVRAYNAHDAKAIAAEWSPHGTYTDQDGTVYKGREAIEQLYQDAFAANPAATVAVAVDEVKLINAFTAIERGTTTVSAKPGAEPTTEQYIATHVRHGTDWVMVSVEDLADSTLDQYAVVQDLAWLVGTWQASTGGLRTAMAITRVGDGPFFQRTWTAWADTNVLVQGVQVIGWDPELRQVASWTFDSRGNTDKGLWSPEENGWAIECSGMLVNGTPFSATYRMTRTDDDTISIKSMNRRAGDVALPDMPALSLTRTAR